MPERHLRSRVVAGNATLLIRIGRQRIAATKGGSSKLSGIGVIFHRNGRLVKREEIEKMARALRPYGPERIVCNLAGSVAFAYAHMSNTPESIFDRQPLQSRDGRYVLVFDGRLDNRDDLQSDLDLSAAEVGTMSDGQLALASFERHRENAPARWVGDFAFIAWDKRDRSLFAARDSLGRRVLNWHETPDRLVIASAAKGIFALGDVPREIDEQKVADALGQLYHDQTRSYFKNVRRLPHAQIMIADQRRVRFSTYWNIGNVASIRYKSDSEYVEAAWERLNTAVKAQMRSRGAVGAFMSGGWDSSTVAITAAQFLQPEGKRLPVFTSVPESRWDGRCLKHEYGDETPYVEAIARMHPRIELNLVPAEGRNQYHRQDEFLNAAEGPARNAVNLCWYHEIQAEAKKRGITTLLEGTTGNATLTWHGADVSREWFRKGQWGRMLRHWWRLHGGRERSLVGFLPKAIWHELLAVDAPEWLWQLYSSRSDKPSNEPRWRRFSFIRPDYARRMSLEARARQYRFNYFDRLRYLTRADRIAMLTTSFSNEVGPIYQGLRALYGLELRDPLADRRLIEFSLGIPTEQYASNGMHRWLIKRMMSDLLPQEITARKGVVGRQCADWHSRMAPALPKMKQDVAALAGDRDTSAMIDTGRIGSLLEKWPDKTITDHADDGFFVFPTVIPLAMAIGRFVRLTKGAND
jgi:asparagine synthase (glutamine-hydrolysing)